MDVEWDQVHDPGLERFVEDYFDAGVKDVGQDYLFSGILYTHNGTMGDYDGYTERHHGDFMRRLTLGEVTVMHGFKDLYPHDDELTEAELAILGPDWRTGEE